MTAILGDEAAARIRNAVLSQGFTRLLGGEVDEVGAGHLAMSLSARAELMQQHGFFHGGASAYLVDNCTTAAAATVLAPATACSPPSTSSTSSRPRPATGSSAGPRW